MNEKKHILQEQFLAFQCDRMNQTEKEEFLEHICSCDYCSDQFSTLMSEDIIIAPRDMKNNILKAIRRPEVQLAIKAKETSKRVQLFIYSLKVCTATVCALLLLLLTMNLSAIEDTSIPTDNIFTHTTTDKEDEVSFTSKLKNGMDIISNHMLEFSNTIMKTEVSDNDQKEK